MQIFKLLFVLAILNVSNAWATPETDRLYLLEKIGILRTWDNMDGVFQDYLSIIYREYFTEQGRFVTQDLSKADDVLQHTKLPYEKLIEDAQVLAQLSRSTRSETLLRTRVYREFRKYRIQIDWIHAPKIDILASDTAFIEEPKQGHAITLEEMRYPVREALDRLFKKLPFFGSVTGRDGSTITVNLGFKNKLRVGDVLQLGTIEEVKKHPVLKSIVEWRLKPTGKIEIEDTDEFVGFGKILEEDKEAPIGRYQKVMAVVPKATETPGAAPSGDLPRTETGDSSISTGKSLNDDETPRIGYVSPGLWLGSHNRQFSLASGGGRTGGGLMIGGRVDAQLWLVSNVFVFTDWAYSFWNHGQEDITTGASSLGGGTGSVFGYRLGLGYAYLPTNNVLGPKAFFRMGYQNHSYDLPINSAEYLGAARVNGLTVGLGGDMPIVDQWAALINVDFGVITNSGLTGITGYNAASSSTFTFGAGAIYRMHPKMSIKAALEVVSDSIDFEDRSSLSQRSIVLAPSLLFYF